MHYVKLPKRGPDVRTHNQLVLLIAKFKQKPNMKHLEETLPNGIRLTGTKQEMLLLAFTMEP